MEENKEPESLSDKPKLSKAERIEKERDLLLNRLVAGRIDHIKDRVAYILNHYPDARNSDVDLAWLYWLNFEGEKFNGLYVTRDEMIALTRQSSLSRTRATIQNEYKLFQAEEEVQQFRGVLEEDHKTAAIENKPTGLGAYTVYIDESGKTQDFLSVGSMWIFSAGPSDVLSHYNVQRWKDDKKIEFEFHFKELTKNRIELYKEFFSLILSNFPEAGFKFAVVKNTGFADLNSAITDLTFHLLHKGVLHEHQTGRAKLPRYLNVWLDEEDKGSDKVKTENLKERITGQNIDGLYLSQVLSVASVDSFFIQAIDLFLGSVNRKLHYPNGNNVKDEFADFVLNVLKINLDDIDKENNDADSAMVLNLRD